MPPHTPLVLGLSELTASFTMVDTAIVVVYLLASVAIGLVANRFITGLSGYLVAGRSLGTALSIATMTGSELGLITVMYQAQKGFTGSFAALHIGLASGIVALAVGLTGFIVVGLRQARVMTIPEYYERRFDRSTRILGATLLALGGILNMGLFLRVGSQFVVGATGMSDQLVVGVMIALLMLVLFYTVMGGMVSVVLTDYVQFAVLSIGLIALVIMSVSHLGYGEIVDTVVATRGLSSFDPTDEFGTGYIAWMGVLGLVNCAIWPTAVTRALAARDVGVVKRQYTFSSISFMIRYLLPTFLGIAAFVFVIKAGGQIVYALNGDEHPVNAVVAEEAGLESADELEAPITWRVRYEPGAQGGAFEVTTLPGAAPEGVPTADLDLTVEGSEGPVTETWSTYRAEEREGLFPAGASTSIKQLVMPGQEPRDSIFGFPIFFREMLPIGLLGLLTAAMLAAFMSTHDSYLLCWASVIARDIIAPLSPKNSSPEKQLRWTRILIILIGLYVLFWGIVYEPSQDVWEYLGITGAVYFTGAIVVLTGGLYWKRASSTGARWALLAGLTAVIGLGPIKSAIGIEGLGPAWIGLGTLGIAFLAMLVGSLLFPDPGQEHDPGQDPGHDETTTEDAA